MLTNANISANAIMILTTTILVGYFLIQNIRANRGVTIIEGLLSFRYAI